jgi:hypothetical protein
VAKELLSPDRGLFRRKDGGRTLEPNPHSAVAAGPDHLSYFALLGRIAGLALYHQVHRATLSHGTYQAEQTQHKRAAQQSVTLR